MVLICFIFCYPVLYLIKQGSGRYVPLVRMRRRIALMGSYLSGIFYRVKHQDPIDWSRTYLICANHTSNLDITALMYACKNDFSFMGKQELLDNPVTGFFFKTVDIPVNRSSKLSAFRAFKKAQECLQAQHSVVIFPEGGISDTFPPKLGTFKNGAFKLALEMQVPILPVVIENAWDIFWDDGSARGSRPGVIHMQLLAPIETRNYPNDADTLRDTVYTRMAEVWNKSKATRNKPQRSDSKK